MQGANTQRMIRSLRGFRAPKGRDAVLSNRARQRLANVMIDASQRAIKAAEDVRLILLAVLGQSGGEVTVTDGTLQQIARGLAHMDYAIVPGEKPGESIVRLIEGKDEPMPQSQDMVSPGLGASPEEIEAGFAAVDNALPEGTPLVVNDSAQGDL